MEKDVHGRPSTFHQQLTGQLRLTEQEAKLIDKCGIDSLSQLMDFVGSGEHATISSYQSCHYKIERWYWYCRRTGWGDAGTTGGKSGKKRFIRNSHNQQVLSSGTNHELGGTSPTSPKRWEVHFDPWTKASQDYGEQAGIPPAHDEGRVYPIIDSNVPNEMSWCPPGGWAERREPRDDPLFTMPFTKPVQVLAVPKHHFTNFKSRSIHVGKPRPRSPKRVSPRKERPSKSTPPAIGSWIDNAVLLPSGVRSPNPNVISPPHADLRVSPPRNKNGTDLSLTPQQVNIRAPSYPSHSPNSPSPFSNRPMSKSPRKKPHRMQPREEFYI